MKLLVIAITSLAFLLLVLAKEKDKSSSEIDHFDIFNIAKNDTDYDKSSDVQRKRDSGYSYSKPDRFLSSHRHESLGIRGRIVSKRPSGQTIRPFNHYGPPKHHQHSGGNRNHHHSNQQSFGISANEFTNGQMNGHQQQVPSPLKQYDFVEPSPIAGQNNEPFNSNGANYLPPRNQKLPGYSNPYAFSNQQQSAARYPNDHQFQMTSNHNNDETFNNNPQSQSLLQVPFDHQQQISDAAIFLAQNSQAISQLYEDPATNLNYEPYQVSEESMKNSQNPNNHFQTFGLNDAAALDSQGLQESQAAFHGTLPSYASGILDQETLREIKSLEKDRLIARLQHALVTSQGKPVTPSTSARYAQNNENGNYIQSQSLQVSQGQINPSIGPQLDRPSKYNVQRPFGATTSTVGSFLPVTVTSSNHGEFTYGLPSTTPAITQSPSTTTSTSTTISSATQRPSQGVTSEGSSHFGTSVSAQGTPNYFPFPQYGGFVPSLVGTNLIANYPTLHGTNFLASSSVNQVESSSPTHFGIPIPTLPASQGTTTIPSNVPSSQKPEATSGHNNHHHSTSIQTIPIQPIHPIAATPVQPTFPIVPAITQIHSVQSPIAPTSGHPNYGVHQPALINPLLVKPIKPVYPLYYYPNVYQFQKPALATLPWNYAPSYAQTKPAQIWK